jgi:hypothetical protein
MSALLRVEKCMENSCIKLACSEYAQAHCLQFIGMERLAHLLVALQRVEVRQLGADQGHLKGRAGAFEQIALGLANEPGPRVDDDAEAEMLDNDRAQCVVILAHRLGQALDERSGQWEVEALGVRIWIEFLLL